MSNSKYILYLFLSIFKIPFEIIKILFTIVINVFKSLLAVCYGFLLVIISFVASVYITAYIYDAYNINIFLCVFVFFIVRQVVQTIILTINRSIMYSIHKNRY